MLTIIKPFHAAAAEKRMDQVLAQAIEGIETECLETAEELMHTELAGKRLLFAVGLSATGINIEYYKMLEYLRSREGCLKGCVAGVIVDGKGELFTKSLARRLVFAANLAGCTFIGKPLVEATGSLYNFHVIGKVWGVDNYSAYAKQSRDLVRRILNFKMPQVMGKQILAIHASNRNLSNSMLLWEKVKENLRSDGEVTEISLRNGQMMDCRGCKYEECVHFGVKNSCFYRGIMVEQVYPAILRCDTLVMICPNYNDAVSANLTAFINRLTSVFRTHDFSRKRVFALVVSGYSGGDIVAEQVIGAMNFNKNFILPAGFAIMKTANESKTILQVPHLEEDAAAFAKRINGI